MSTQGQYLTAAAAAAGVLGGVYCAYKTYSKRLPQKWKQVGTLTELNAYPIKSCGPVELNEAECSVLGLKDGWMRDRALMVVDSANNFITARGYPEMLLVHPKVRNAVLTLEHKDMEPLHVNLAEVAATQEIETAKVWGDPVPVWDCGKEAGEWFTKLLKEHLSDKRQGFHLVYYATQTSRKMRDRNSYAYYNITKNDTGALPDELSYNLINQASVDDLNKRMKDCEVTARNFRPNFVMSEGSPYDEDNWRFVKIGENIFEVIKPCCRCVLTTIDPETGVRHPASEPLETLKGYRQIEDPVIRKAAGNSPRMGLQMSLRSAAGGRIKLNDPIYVSC